MSNHHIQETKNTILHFVINKKYHSSGKVYDIVVYEKKHNLLIKIVQEYSLAKIIITV